MTLNEAIEAISINLIKVLEKIELLEEKNLKEKDLINLNILKSQIIGCSNLILGIEERKDSLDGNYIIYEIQTAQALCKKTLKTIREIESLE